MCDPTPSRKPANNPCDVKRLLVLDDDEAVRSPLVKYLSTRGCCAVGAAEPEEAEALLDHETFHLVILDLGLSRFGRNGLAVLASVRARHPRLPVIILSGHISPEVEEEARRMGATAVLEKPHPLPALARLALDLMGGTR